MTQYYSVVYKDSGKMNHHSSNYTDISNYPVNEEELALVPLNDYLTRALTSLDPADHEDLGHINFYETYYDFENTEWVIIHYPEEEIHKLDVVEEKLKERDALVVEAQIKLKIIDLPDNMRQQLVDYIDNLNSIEVTPENCRDTIYDRLPF